MYPNKLPMFNLQAFLGNFRRLQEVTDSYLFIINCKPIWWACAFWKKLGTFRKLHLFIQLEFLQNYNLPCCLSVLTISIVARYLCGLQNTTLCYGEDERCSIVLF